MSRRTTVAILTLFALVIALPACQKQSTTVDDSSSTGQVQKKEGPVLANVGDHVITVAEFQAEIDSLPEYAKKQLKTSDQKMKRLDNMIKSVVLQKEAKRRGLDKDQDIQRKVERYKNRLITEKLYQQVAKETGGVTEAEVEEYYDDHKKQYVQKERIRASQILILVPPNADAKKQASTKTKAEEALKKVKAGEDFSALASQYSEGPTAVRGGDLGFFSKGRMVPEFEEVAFSIDKVGDVSEIVKTKFGYHIVKLTDKQPEKQLELSEVKDRISRQLESKKRREVRQTLDKDLRSNLDIEINEEYLAVDSEEKAPEPPKTEKHDHSAH